MPQLDLTDRFVQTAKPENGQRQTDFYDTNSRGAARLLLRVSSTAKSWVLLYRAPADHRRDKLVLGNYPTIGLAKARTMLREARSYLAEGKDPRIVAQVQKATALTVKGLVESYMSRYVRAEELRSGDEIERRLRLNVLPLIGDVKIAELHKRHVNLVIDPIVDRGAKVEAARVYEDLRSMLRWATARGDLDRCPMDGMRKPEGGQPGKRALDDAEIKAFWHMLPTALERSKPCQRILKLCLVTGQRVGEVSGLPRSELDLKAKIWTLPATRAKNETEHVIPLSDLAVEIIEAALNDAGDAEHLFRNRDGAAFDPLVVTKTLLRAFQPSKPHPEGRFPGLKPFTPHDLRRTVGTGMGTLRISPLVRGHVLNHLSITKAGITLGVYDQGDYLVEKTEALQRWADHVRVVIGQE